MFKRKKCPDCEEKIKDKFSYCPWCGHSFKRVKKQEDWGMIGESDEAQQQEQVQLPFGFNGIINKLMKQIEKDLSGMDGNSPIPKGFKIKISTGAPTIQPVGVNYGDDSTKKEKEASAPYVPIAEIERRSKLKRIDAKSTIRRLPEGVIYEIEAPGVRSENDIAITRLEQSLEVKAYSKDKCYVKMIPMKVEILGVSVKNNKVFLKVRG